MAEMKKYLDTIALGTLVDQIKSEDAKTLAAAKDYTDKAPFDAAGSATTAETNAKAHAEAKVKELADGQVKTNTDAIAKLNGDVATEGSVAKAVKDAQDALQGNIDAVDEKADANAEAIAAINNAETGILKQAKDYTDTEVAKVQGAVDSLGEKVGELPEGTTATTVVEYVNKKTEGIATDAALGELNSQVSGLQTAVQNIQKDYLVEADKTELQGNIDGVDGKVDEVAGKVTTLIGEDTNKSVRTIANEELAKQLIAEGAKESLDTLAEIATWIQSHPDDASAMNKAIEDLEALVGTLPEGVTATTVVGYVQEVVAAETSARETAISGLDTRLQAIEGAVGESGSVAQDIADAEQRAKDAAAQDATTKANKALEDAKAYTDTEVGKDRARLDALEAIDHSHANQAELDKFVDGDKAKLDDAVAKAHEHANAAELAKIADGDVAKWNASEQNAKDYAKGLDDATNVKVDGIGTRVGTLETTIVDKAEADDLDAAVERIAKNETDIAGLTSTVNSFTAITPDEVNALFA